MAEKTWVKSGDGNELARSLLFPNENGEFDLVDKDNGLPVSFAGGANVDAFSRLRVGVPALLWDSKSVFGEDTHSYQEVVVGAGSSSTWQPNESSIRLTCDTGATDKIIRQTKKYFPYIPGHSQIIFKTFNMLAAPTANCVKREGRFDDNDGIFLEWNENDIRFVIRSSTSGTPSDAEFATQANWNLDTLNGSNDKNNPSGINLNLAKVQILVIDYQWLGVGRVRVGFDLDGVLIYCHEFNHANVDDVVYMQTPNLPLRSEISNTGVTSGANSIDVICSSVISEGGLQPLGHDYAVDTGTTGVTVTPASLRLPVLAVRQNPVFNGKVNRRIAILNTLGLLSLGDNVFYEVVQYPEPNITITGGWVDLDADHSSMQYAVGTNITVNSEVGSHPFYKDFLTSSSLGSKISPGAANAALGVRTHHNEMLVNYDGTDCEVIVIWATVLPGGTGTSTLYATANCLEYA